MLRIKEKICKLFLINIIVTCFYCSYAYEENNVNLENLAVENLLLIPPFENDITSYEIEVFNETENLNILAVPEDENATVEIIGNEKLKLGDNLIKVVVTAQDGFSEKIYEINVYKRNDEEDKLYEEEKQSNQEKLEELYKAEKTSISFDKDIENKENNKNYFFENGRIILIIFFVGLFIILFLLIKNKKQKNKK